MLFFNDVPTTAERSCNVHKAAGDAAAVTSSWLTARFGQDSTTAGPMRRRMHEGRVAVDVVEESLLQQMVVKLTAHLRCGPRCRAMASEVLQVSSPVAAPAAGAATAATAYAARFLR